MERGTAFYEAVVKWPSTRPRRISIENKKHEWRNRSFKLTSVCPLTPFCHACNKVAQVFSTKALLTLPKLTQYLPNKGKSCICAVLFHIPCLFCGYFPIKAWTASQQYGHAGFFTVQMNVVKINDYGSLINRRFSSLSGNNGCKGKNVELCFYPTRSNCASRYLIHMFVEIGFLICIHRWSSLWIVLCFALTSTFEVF